MMMEQRLVNTGALRHNELETVYAISRVVVEAASVDDALGEIVELARQVFIFDNAVIYWAKKTSPDKLEPKFARAIGRGRSSEESMPWGEFAAQKVIASGKNYVHEIKPPTDDSARIEHQFYIGLPMVLGGDITGAIVFIRFGGPEFAQDQILLAEFITNHITQLYEYRRLAKRIANLEAERRLEQLQEDFMAMVSHELNTPLGFIKGYTTTLLRQDTDWDKKTVHEFLQIIDEESDRLAELIENLLDSSRLQSGTMNMDMRVILVNSLVSNILDRVRTRYNNVELKVEISPNSIEVLADHRRFAQVMENLIGNAAKYAPRSTLKISIKPNNGGVDVGVQDNGPGIPPEHLEHVFKRFYRVPERSAGVRGTGLGLFICDQIIEAHKGTISVKSKLDQGTKFTIWLPEISELEGKDDD